MTAVSHRDSLEQKLLEAITRSPDLTRILERVEALGLPDWRLGGGGLAQTVWNIQHGFDLRQSIRDYDLVYFDEADRSYEAEDAKIRLGRVLFADLPIPVEIRNQARVHLWYPKRFGAVIDPYRSVEDAIATWPTTAAAVAVHLEHGRTVITAPFGLDDLFAMIARPNKAQITEEIYENKVRRWAREWPQLRVVPWADAG